MTRSETGLDGREIEVVRPAGPGPDPLRSLADVESVDVDSGPGASPGLLLEIPSVRRGPDTQLMAAKTGLPSRKRAGLPLKGPTSARRTLAAGPGSGGNRNTMDGIRRSRSRSRAW